MCYSWGYGVVLWAGLRVVGGRTSAPRKGKQEMASLTEILLGTEGAEGVHVTRVCPSLEAMAPRGGFLRRAGTAAERGRCAFCACRASGSFCPGGICKAAGTGRGHGLHRRAAQPGRGSDPSTPGRAVRRGGRCEVAGRMNPGRAA